MDQERPGKGVRLSIWSAYHFLNDRYSWMQGFDLPFDQPPGQEVAWGVQIRNYALAKRTELGERRILRFIARGFHRDRICPAELDCGDQARKRWWATPEGDTTNIEGMAADR
jgi:hypothetical protein